MNFFRIIFLFKNILFLEIRICLKYLINELFNYTKGYISSGGGLGLNGFEVVGGSKEVP